LERAERIGTKERAKEVDEREKARQMMHHFSQRKRMCCAVGKSMLWCLKAVEVLAVAEVKVKENLLVTETAAIAIVAVMHQRSLRGGGHGVGVVTVAAETCNSESHE